MRTTFPLFPALKMKHIGEQGFRAKAAASRPFMQRDFFFSPVKYGIANPKTPCV